MIKPKQDQKPSRKTPNSTAPSLAFGAPVGSIHDVKGLDSSTPPALLPQHICHLTSCTQTFLANSHDSGVPIAN